MDLAQFQLIRPVRRIQPDEHLALAPEVTIPPKPRLEPSGRPGEATRFTLSDLPAEEYAEGNDPLAVLPFSSGLTLFQRVYAVVNWYDRWLRSFNDRVPAPAVGTPSGVAAAEQLATLLKAYQISDEAWYGASMKVRLGYHRALKTLMTTNPKTEAILDTAVLLTRRVLVASLISPPLTPLATLDEEQIYSLLNRRTVSLSDVDRATGAPGAKVELIRKATTSDLRVVRREWKSYLASEVANIRNLMGGETVKFTLKNVRETETTEVTEAERREQRQQEDESRMESELSQEVNSQLQVAINGYFDASAEYKAGMVTASISAGVDAGFAMERSERHASRIAREAVSRAISRVDSMTRESRTVRSLTRTEDENEYSLANTGGNLHAVYRWVDRIDSYQIFRYPDRFLLEFQLPEPAEFYRWRTDRQKAAQSATKAPPPWKLVAADITPERLIELASTYHATSVPPALDPEITLSRTIVVQLGKEDLPASDSTTIWNLPSAGNESEIGIPTNYAAVSIWYSGHGFPVLGKWKVAGLAQNNALADVYGFRSGFATVSIGRKSEVNWVGGFAYNSETPGPGDLIYLSHYGDVTDIGSALQVQTAPDNNPSAAGSFGVPYGRAMLVIGKDAGPDLRPDPSDEIRFDPPAMGPLEVAVSTTGLASCVVTFEVKCKQTEQSYNQWQLDVYDALFAAWSQWNDEWESAQGRQAVLGMTGADAGGSLRNEQIIREELKRQVVAWLLGESPFKGRGALRTRQVDSESPPTEANFGETDFDKARESAVTIQFLEQAFEWNNMSYMFYPYYWADRKMWEELAKIQANDAEFERFLRAGSARVIVPARPGFTNAVETWLLHQVPFVSGQLPAIGEELYVSIDREIRDLTDPWRGGIPEDYWQARISTTMLYLDTKDELPFTNDLAQLPAEKGKPFEPKLI